MEIVSSLLPASLPPHFFSLAGKISYPARACTPADTEFSLYKSLARQSGGYFAKLLDFFYSTKEIERKKEIDISRRSENHGWSFYCNIIIYLFFARGWTARGTHSINSDFLSDLAFVVHG